MKIMQFMHFYEIDSSHLAMKSIAKFTLNLSNIAKYFYKFVVK